jgi:hypothetical protein
MFNIFTIRLILKLLNKYSIKLAGIFSLLILLTESALGQPISDYICYTGWGICKKEAKEVIVFRKYNKGNQTYFFTVNPQSLNTAVVRADSISVTAETWPAIFSRFALSPYIMAIKQVASDSQSIQDAGFTQFNRSQKGIDLTIDLCPSHRPLDRIVFTDLIKEMIKVERPVPLSVSITGRWMNMHPADLNWLDSLVKAGDLSIVWINHTYNHYVTKNVPLTENFILAPGTNINSEVLNTEIALLERHLTPSIFFRFPGLVSDQTVFDKILNLGLIPVGSDAWLAKGQWPTDGSIVLIHANGNEPIGVHDFINLLKTEQSEVVSRHWELFDLRESLIDDELE